MVLPRISALYAALLAAVFLTLSLRVALTRWRRQEYLGQGDELLARQIRAHANFAENVPFALLLLAFGEAMGAQAILVHGLGGVLLCSRVLHAYGVSKQPEPILMRVVGYTLTCVVIGAAALLIVYRWFA
ncbi:MAG: MAPEG family protein [Bradyrhizobium sp.]|uniref:MAPEG family protein n=1 Tax=Bradyrhizobium sp. TaxID=376 RepID=UPI0025C273E2|nr:MAPEG family protein [Bradyrhizobium sp.]MBI5262128.1 MAPEG family protein [Bradyrhizobium sp.]